MISPGVFEPREARMPYEAKEAEAMAINSVLAPYGINIDNVIEGPKIIQYRATLDPSANVSKLKKMLPSFKIALNCDDVELFIKGNQLILQKPGADNTIRLKEFYNAKLLNGDGIKLIMGVDIEGNHIYTDLAKQPHMLVAGTTGSGKSMFLHQCIISILAKHANANIYAIDTKKVEFNSYSSIPNFTYVTNEEEAVNTLYRLTLMMESRYEIFAKYGYRDFNHAVESGVDVPPIVCVIDEFADLIMHPKYSKQIEEFVVRLAQKARAAGIHLIIATQRPTANVLTGLIKANIPSRVCLKVASAMESRIILDRTGGEHLQGKGDLLFLSNGSFDPIRLQACYVSTTEMRNVGIDLTPKADTNTKKADGFLKRLFKK